MKKTIAFIFMIMTVLVTLLSCSTTKYNLTLAINDETYGTISGEGVFAYNSNITVLATPNKGYLFLGWYEKEELKSRETSYTFLMPSHDITLLASFKVDSNYIETFAITYDINDPAFGSVSVLDKQPAGNTVVAKATPNSGYKFAGWYHDSEFLSGETTYNFVMPANSVHLSAKFVLENDPTFLVTINISDSKMGNVSGAGAAAFNEAVSLTATANDGYRFLGWYLNNVIVSADATYQFEMPNNNLVFEARFESTSIFKYNLTLEYDKTYASVVGNGYYSPEQLVTITTNVKPGYAFLGWFLDDELISSKLLYSFNIKNTMTLTARFETNRYALLVESTSYGSVSGVPDNDLILFGTPISLKASLDDPNYVFVGWFDSNSNLLSTDFEYNFTMPSYDLTITATFNTKAVVAFETSVNEVTVNSVLVARGDKVPVPNATHPLLVVVSWYTDPSLNNIWDFENDLCQSNMTLFAKWGLRDGTNVNADVYSINDSLEFGFNEGEDFSILKTAVLLNNFNFNFLKTSWTSKTPSFISDSGLVLDAKTNTHQEVTLTVEISYYNLKTTFDHKFVIPAKPNITFISNGAVYNESRVWINNSLTPIKDPTVPPRQYFVFDGWYINDSSVKFSFDDLITSPLTLVARWVEDEVISIEITEYPAKLRYEVGEPLLINGLSTRGHYKNGGYKALDTSFLQINGFDSTLASESGQTVEVSYNGLVDNFTVFIALSSKAITENFDFLPATAPDAYQDRSFIGIHGINYELIGAKVGSLESNAVTIQNNGYIAINISNGLSKISFNALSTNNSQISVLVNGTLISEYQISTNPELFETAFLDFRGDTIIELLISGDDVTLDNLTWNDNHYEIMFYLLTFKSSNNSLGAVSAPTYDNGVPYPENYLVTLNVITFAGSRFIGWFNENGYLVSENALYVFNIYKETLLTARFAKTYRLNVSATTGGSINSDVTNNSYLEDDLVNLVATENPGYVFDGWYNGAVLLSKEKDYTLEMPASDLNLTARFLFAFTANVSSNDTALGTISYLDDDNFSGNIPVLSGYNITLTASANDNSIFKHWLVNDIISGNATTRTFTITSDTTIKAVFEAITYTVSVAVAVDDTLLSDYSLIVDLNYSTTAIKNESITLNATLLNNNYYFDNWINSDTEEIFNSLSSPVIISNNANFILNLRSKIEITFDYDTSEIANSFFYGIPLVDVVILPSTPNRTNYTFNGWLDSNNNPYSGGICPETNTTYTASWLPSVSSTVSFITYIDSYLEPDVTTDSSGKISQPQQTNSAYTTYSFLGWYESLDFENHTPVDFNNYVFASDTVLHARWDLEETVRTNWLNTFTPSFSGPDSSFGVKNNITLPLDTISDFSFYSVSWSSSHPSLISNDGTLTPPTSSTANTDVTLTLIISYYNELYNEIPFTATYIGKSLVTFDSNGADPVSSQLVYNGDKVEKPSDPLKADYSFLYWTFNGLEFDFDSVLISSDITLIASFTYNANLISISLNTDLAKKEYLVGDLFDNTNIVVNANYDNGETLQINLNHPDLLFTNTDFTIENSAHKITVTYLAFTTDFDVVVAALELGLEIRKNDSVITSISFKKDDPIPLDWSLVFDVYLLRNGASNILLTNADFSVEGFNSSAVTPPLAPLSIDLNYSSSQGPFQVTLDLIITANSIIYTFSNITSGSTTVLTNETLTDLLLGALSGSEENIVSSITAIESVYRGNSTGGTFNNSTANAHLIKLGKSSEAGTLTFNLSQEVSSIKLLAHNWDLTSTNTMTVNSLASQTPTNSGTPSWLEFQFDTKTSTIVISSSERNFIFAIEFIY